MLTNLLVRCFLVLAMLLGWSYWKHRRIIRAAREMKAVLPMRFQIVRYVPYLLGIERCTAYIFGMIAEVLKEGFDMTYFWFGLYPLLMIGGPENTQKILNSSCTSERGDDMKFADFILGRGILTAPGDIWKITRQHMNPMFHPNNLQYMMPSFNRNSEELVQVFSEHVGQGQFDAMGPVMDSALKTICNLIFGPDIDVDIKSQEFKGLRKMVEWIPEICQKRVSYVWLRVDAIFYFLYNKELDEMNKRWNQFTDTSLKKTKQKMEKKLEKLVKEQSDKSNNISSEKSTEFINLIDVYRVLEEKYPHYSEADLKFEMASLYVAGTDTAASTVSSCLMLLAYHQDVQERLYNEVKEISPDGDVTLADLQNLQYLDQVYKETLRWNKLIPLVGRKTSEDLNLGSITIPAGYQIQVCIGMSMMDPSIFPNPAIFDPERFSPTNTAKRKRYSFLPFGGGPHTCIGQTYSNIFIKIILVHVLRKFKLSTTMDIHNLTKKLVMILMSTEGYKVILESR